MDSFHLYKDIKDRTDGEIYIGVVGPVRCGKSTFIKRFMETLVIPTMTDENKIARTKDELPQSSDGKTIMTTEPKFIPKEAATIRLDEETSVKIRLIDCVGYMVDSAVGHIENDKERMVKTPWFDYDIPFTKAAEIGTRKVISDHWDCNYRGWQFWRIPPGRLCRTRGTDHQRIKITRQTFYCSFKFEPPLF